MAAAAELARESERWDLAARMLERLKSWGEASDMHELAGNIEQAGACAERAGEDARALQLYRRINRPDRAAHCLARLGSLQDALLELHGEGRLDEAADAEGAAGRPREAAQLRMRQLRELQDRLSLTHARGDAQTPESERLRRQIRQEAESLITHLGDLGMEREMIEVLRSAGASRRPSSGWPRTARRRRPRTGARVRALGSRGPHARTTLPLGRGERHARACGCHRAGRRVRRARRRGRPGAPALPQDRPT